MSFQFNNKIICNSSLNKLDRNNYSLIFKKYNIFNLEEEIEIFRENGEKMGKAKIYSIFLEDNYTKIKFELTSLNTIN